MKKKKKINSKQKGKVGERELRDELKFLFQVDARRGQQFKGTSDSPDVVVGIPDIHIECKRVESFHLYNSMRQAEEDADGLIPVVCHRKNEERWVAVCFLDDLPELAKTICSVLK